MALRRSEAVMGNLRADTPESTSVVRNVPEVSLNRRKIDEFEIFRSKMTAVTSTTLPTSGLAWALHRFQNVSHPKNNSFQVPAAPFKRGLGRMAHSYYFACNPNSSWHNKPNISCINSASIYIIISDALFPPRTLVQKAQAHKPPVSIEVLVGSRKLMSC